MKERKINAESTWFMTIFFPLKFFYFWFFCYAYKGFLNKLKFSNLPNLLKNLESSYYDKKFTFIWMKLKNLKKYRLFLSLQYCFWFEFWVLSGTLSVLSVFCFLFIPKLIEKLFNEMTPIKTDDLKENIEFLRLILPDNLKPPRFDDLKLRENNLDIWWYFLGIVGLQIIATLLQEMSIHISSKVGIKSRALLTSQIYQKTLKLSNKSRLKYQSGKIISLISVDANVMDEFHVLFHQGWTGIITIIGCIWFLIEKVDWGVLTSQTVSIITIPITILVFYMFSVTRKKGIGYMDDRIKLLNEILQGIKIIKLFNWENSYIEKIRKIRNKELFWLRIVAISSTVAVAVATFYPVAVQIIAFISYFFIHDHLSSTVVFTSAIYFNLLILPCVRIPEAALRSIESLICLNRITNILEADELKELKICDNKDYPVEIINADFRWNTDDEVNLEKKKNVINSLETNGKLTNINVKFKKGDLVMIIGEIGSGKSNFLKAILSEMEIVKGELRVSSSIAYCSQIPWLTCDTFLENICFGNKLDEKKYKNIVDVCELTKDLEILKGGRLAEIGESGVTLSGGQKSRCSLARCCYSNADIYLLDDPLSSVDSQVGRHIFEKCVIGYLKNKTRVLVTNQLKYLQHADLIILMKDGKISKMGSYKEFRNVDFKISDSPMKIVARKENKSVEKVKNEFSQTLIRKEEKSSSLFFNFNTLKTYLRAMGTVSLIIILFSIIFTEVIRTGIDWFLAEFSSLTFNEEYGKGYNTSFFFKNGTMLNGTFNPTTLPYYYNSNNTTICPGVYCQSILVELFWDDSYKNSTLIKTGISSVTSIIIIGILVISLLGLQLLNTYFTYISMINGLKVLHSKALVKVIQGTMNFFDTTPIGRIISRFSRDLSNLEYPFIDSTINFIKAFSVIIGYFGLIVYTTRGFFIPFFLIILFLFFMLFLFYKNTVVELKRIENVSRSPLFAFFSESFVGLPIIRAYKRQKDFTKLNERNIDQNNIVIYMFNTSQRWVIVVMLIISVITVGSITVICVLLYYYGKDDPNVSYFALSISYSFLVTFYFTYAIKMLSDAGAFFNSAERIDYYIKNVESENFQQKKNLSESEMDQWPKESKIEFSNVSARYRANLPLVLNNINMIIKPKEKVGICGRTGSGKSSLMLAIYRMIEIESGKILIGNDDTKEIGLELLRSKLSIIPQDSVLFSGTVKSNLDPFNKYTDIDCWDAIEKSHLKVIIQSRNGLDSIIEEKGNNFSSGERQLMCLARSIVRKPRILILDECTANVDENTDKLIQTTIMEEFKDSTVLTIAHRVKTILEYDRIIVMDNCKIVEFDTPQNLLKLEKYSLFKQLVKESGINIENLQEKNSIDF